MTPAERDRVIERIADGILDHEDRSADRHADLHRRIDQLDDRIGEVLAAYRSGLIPTIERTLSRITSTTTGSVALCALIAVMILTGAAVWLGAPEVLAILAGRVQIAPTLDGGPAAPPSPPATTPLPDPALPETAP